MEAGMGTGKATGRGRQKLAKVQTGREIEKTGTGITV